MTRGQLKTRVARMTGVAVSGTSDDDVAEAALLDELANEAIIDILTRTRVHVRKAAILLDVGITEFEIDDFILRMHAVWRGETPLNLGDPGASGYDFVGFNRIVLNTAGAGDDLIAYYTPRPTPMTDDTHDPNTEAYGNIPPEFHPAILNYMMWHAADRSGDQGSQRGERYRVLYEGQDGTGMGGSNLGRIKIATNTRSRATRVTRAREVLASDAEVNPWVG